MFLPFMWYRFVLTAKITANGRMGRRMEQTTNEFILKWIMNARCTIGFQCEDDPALMLLIVRQVISALPGQSMPRWEAEQIYRSLRLAADEYKAEHPELQLFGGYDTPLAKIKILLDKTWRRSP
jgi:hypothetical protein